MLSPGPMHQHYAEHAYLARYLGLLLVEGEDLIVTDGQAMVRTVSGPKPLSLLWNRRACWTPCVGARCAR